MAGRSGSRVAAHTPCARIGDVTFGLTVAQARIIRDAMRTGGMTHVTGATLRSAQALVRLRLGELRDDGQLGRGGNADGERWAFTVADGVHLV